MIEQWPKAQYPPLHKKNPGGVPRPGVLTVRVQRPGQNAGAKSRVGVFSIQPPQLCFGIRVAITLPLPHLLQRSRLSVVVADLWNDKADEEAT
jgi:hypothetical protein